ncbi:hypothetical protein [Flavicella sediminum]|uniref:hypothetical protein n=1 Tax=Flavicella sediminum TaxID=2585141 RepID=UPI00111D10B4|nr:hypothetical protein [Flavicella sediminum]
MIAETLYPLVDTLSKAEKEKLLVKLTQDIGELKNAATQMTQEEKDNLKQIEWLKTHVLKYPPKESLFS